MCKADRKPALAKTKNKETKIHAHVETVLSHRIYAGCLICPGTEDIIFLQRSTNYIIHCQKHP